LFASKLGLNSENPEPISEVRWRHSAVGNGIVTSSCERRINSPI
jgi:hypothetical protein